MGKRGTGEGTVFKRVDGRWVGSVSLGFDQNGKRIRKVVYGKTQKEVNDKLDNLKQQRKHGAKSIVGKDTVEGYLQRWLDDDVAINRDEKTFQEYEGTVRLYITPFIGSIKLTKLTGEDLVGWQGKLARKKFTANMRLRSIRVLRNGLNKAVKLRILPFNPVMALDKPKVVRKEVVPLEPKVCHDLFAACQQHRLGDIIILAAMTGLRKGELFAIEWSAVNFADGVLVVRRQVQELRGLKVKEPKTNAGKRVVSLDPVAIEALRSRLRKAKEEGFEPDEVPIVFPNIRGGYLRGSNFDRNVWYPIRDAVGIPDTFVFHDLRHTQASLLLAAGVDLKVIQKRLGHRDFATTANTYSHLLQGAQNEAIEKMSAMMQKSAPPKPDPQ
ncbi:MAG: tyrosine-type recombinase/integrase [Planctomycetaceae bacterium]